MKYKIGDAVEFLSDKQTEKGPSAGVVESSISGMVLIRHSHTVEAFDSEALVLQRKTSHHDGRRLWQFS